MPDSDRPPIPRNRTRAQRLASGLRGIEVHLPPELVEVLDQAARAAGQSRNEYVRKWLERLEKREASKNRQGDPK